MTQKALSGMKVLDWTQFITGPYCTKLLADLGAEVVKVESPGAGDVARRREPFLNDVPHSERSGLFLYLNTNKLGITLDVKTPGGKKIFQELIKQVDILVEDNTPRIMEDLNLTYEELKDFNPRLIMASITPFGQTGPYRDYKAYPLNTFHSGGEGRKTPSGSRTSDREPLMVGRFFGEYAVGVVAAGAILAAYFGRELTGLGQHIDISKQETLSWLDAWNLHSYAMRMGKKTDTADLSGTRDSKKTKSAKVRVTYECKDGYLLFATISAKEFKYWSNFYKALIYPDVDERLNDPNYISEHRKELADLSDELLMKRTREEIYSAPSAKQCPLAPYNKMNDVVDSPQMEARGFFVEFDHPEAGRLKYPSAPYQFSETPWRVERSAPLLGQYNEDIYCRYLGYSKQDLVKLREGGII